MLIFIDLQWLFQNFKINLIEIKHLNFILYFYNFLHNAFGLKKIYAIIKSRGKYDKEIGTYNWLFK